MRSGAALICLLAAGAGAGAQPQAVAVRVSVESPAAAFLTELSPADFSVTINGVAVRVASVTTSDTPVSLQVLVDLTHSVEITGPLDPARFADTARRGLLGRLRPTDRLRVGWFAGQQRTLGAEWATGPASHRSAIEAIERAPVEGRHGAAPIWDAVAEGVAALAAEPSPRTILVVSDGYATGNRLGVEDVARLAVAAAVPVHVLFVPNRMEGERANRLGRTFLDRLAETTGGVLRELPDHLSLSLSFSGPTPPFSTFVESIRAELTLRLEGVPFAAGSSAGLARLQPLDVQVARPGVRVHAPNWLPLVR